MKTKVLLAACLTMFVSCKKEPVFDVDNTPTTTDLLAGTDSKTWLLTRLTSRVTTGGVVLDPQDDLAKLDACQRDNE